MSFLLLGSAAAFDPTAKSITVVIPYPPGGGVDRGFRDFEKWTSSKKLSLQFNVIYKPGAEGLIGINEISKLPADGYHIFFGNVGNISIQRIKNPEAKIELITAISDPIIGFVVHKDSGINSLQDLTKISNIKAGVGTPAQRLSVLQLMDLSNNKIQAKLVPYKGGSPVVQDIIGNHITLAAVPLELVHRHVTSGTLKLLAVGSKTRFETFKNVPSIYEFYPNWKGYTGKVVVMPKGISSEVNVFWSNLFKEYMNDPAVKEKIAREYNEIFEFGPIELNKMADDLKQGLLSEK